MTTNDEVILNQNGEETDVLASPEFGQGLALVNPSELPDLDSAEVGYNIQPESIEFTQPGQTLRAVFVGFTVFKVKDKINKGQYLEKKTAVFQTKTGIKINMGANMVKQLEMIPAGNAIEIKYRGTVKSNSGNDVKDYEIHLLNVPRANVANVQLPRTSQLPAQTNSGTPQFKNTQYATAFWNTAAQMKFTHDDGMAHLKEFDYDMKAALDALGGEAE